MTRILSSSRAYKISVRVFEEVRAPDEPPVRQAGTTGNLFNYGSLRNDVATTTSTLWACQYCRCRASFFLLLILA